MKITKKLALVFLGAIGLAYGTDCTISDTVRTPFGGYFAGKITVVLNSPSLAQPLYSGSQTLTGWQTTIDVPASANGAVAVTLVCTDSITPSGTSYAARYQPTSGAGWAETWTPATGTTTIRAMRSTTVPTPAVTFQPSQLLLGAGSLIYGSSAGVGTSLAPGTNGHVLTLSGGYPSWATPAACATCVTTAGSYADPAWITSLAGSKITGGLVTGITGTANQITASASTGAVTLSLPATITGLTSVTATGFTGALTGNASTATALASSVTSGRLWIGNGTGVPTSDSTLLWDTARLLVGLTSATGTKALNVNGAIQLYGSSSIPRAFLGPPSWDGSYLALQNATMAEAASSAALYQDSVGNTSVNAAATKTLALRVNNAAAVSIPSTLNLLIGTTTDLGYGLAAQKTGSTGTLLAKDPTSTTGFTRVLFDLGAADTASTEIFRLNGTMRFGGTNTTGAGSAALGSNSPATTNTAPYTWIRAVAADGSTVYIPAWK